MQFVERIDDIPGNVGVTQQVLRAALQVAIATLGAHYAGHVHQLPAGTLAGRAIFLRHEITCPVF